jgi:predicted ATPase
MVTKGYASLEVERVYQRVQQLCQDNTVEEPLLSQVLRGLITFHVIRAELQTAHKLGEQLLHLAQRSQNATLMLWSHLALGQSFFCRGELSPACKHLEAGWALYDPHKRRSPRATQDLGVTMLAYAALALWLRGYPTQAWHRQEEAMRLAHALAHPFSLAFGWHHAAVLHRFRRAPVDVQACAEALITLSTEQTFAQYLAIGTMQQGWVCAVQGQGQEGVRQIRQGVMAYQDTGGELFRPYWLVLLVEAYRCADQLEEGLTVLAEALTLVHKTEERWYEAELYRLKGELLLQQSFENHSEAETCFQKAIAIAQNQSAKSWELRAATSLAKWWQSQGKRDDARELLGEIYGWFTEGFDTADLKDAKMLLDELS